MAIRGRSQADFGPMGCRSRVDFGSIRGRRGGGRRGLGRCRAELAAKSVGDPGSAGARRRPTTAGGGTELAMQPTAEAPPLLAHQRAGSAQREAFPEHRAGGPTEVCGLEGQLALQRSGCLSPPLPGESGIRTPSMSLPLKTRCHHPGLDRTPAMHERAATEALTVPATFDQIPCCCPKQPSLCDAFPTPAADHTPPAARGQSGRFGLLATLRAGCSGSRRKQVPQLPVADPLSSLK